MKTKVKTKEELIVEITEVKADNEDWSSSNTRRKKEFAKAFGWYESNSYGYGKEPLKPSWEEIFIEIGRLTGSVDNENRLKTIESTLDYYGGRIDKLVGKNENT